MSGEARPAFIRKDHNWCTKWSRAKEWPLLGKSPDPGTSLNCTSTLLEGVSTHQKQSEPSIPGWAILQAISISARIEFQFVSLCPPLLPTNIHVQNIHWLPEIRWQNDDELGVYILLIPQLKSYEPSHGFLADVTQGFYLVQDKATVSRVKSRGCSGCSLVLPLQNNVFALWHSSYGSHPLIHDDFTLLAVWIPTNSLLLSVRGPFIIAWHFSGLFLDSDMNHIAKRKVLHQYKTMLKNQQGLHWLM